MIRSKIQVIRTFSEGECCITEVTCIKRNIFCFILFYIFSLATGGLVFLFFLWIPILQKKFLYKESDMSDSSHVWIKNWDSTHHIEEITKQVIVQKLSHRQNDQDFYSFYSRHLRYYYNEERDAFIAVEMDVQEILNQIQNNGKIIEEYQLNESRGLQNLKQCYGSSMINVPIPSYGQLFLDEVVHPFFVFQMYSTILWCLEAFYFFTILIFVTTMTAAIYSLITIRKNLVKVNKMAFVDSQVKVNRENQYQTLNSSEFVPGDIIKIEENMKIPADCIVIQGQILINESSLTGESIPIFKYPIDNNIFEEEKSKKNVIYCGTEVLRIQNKNIDVQALVIRTSFSTIRGQLIRSILYPKPHKFSFYTQIMILLLLFFTISCIIFGLLYPRLIILGMDVLMVWTFFDLVTISCPPQLAAAFSIGISFSLVRLKKENISCISPPKVVEGGTVDTVCFDKTGTLTEEGMHLKGILPIKKQDQQIILNSQIGAYFDKNFDNETYFFSDCMSNCHSLVIFDQQLVGDPMEKELFKATQSQIQEEGEFLQVKNKKRTSTIIKKFEFSSQAQCMSVIVQINEERYLFTKGAPEKIQKLCIQGEINKAYDDLVENYSQSGYRILSLAYRHLPKSTTNYDRVEVEKQLYFLGFVFFENQVKLNSQPTIQQLNNAEIRIFMITGDNILTASDVARQVQIIPPTKQVVVCKFTDETKEVVIQVMQNEVREKYRIRAREQTIDSLDNNLNENLFKSDKIQKFEDDIYAPLEPSIEPVIINGQMTQYLSIFLNEVSKYDKKKYSFSISGNFFQELLQQVKEKPDLLKKLNQFILRTRVFARMKPHQKTELIELLQNMNLKVAMVGDGCNDCGALKQANVGIALSDQEASISAPFTAQNLQIESIISLLRLCRAGLATSFQSFKSMIGFSMIQFTTAMVLDWCYSQPSDIFYLYWDLFINTTLITTISLTQACDELGQQIPPHTIFTTQCLLSIFGQMIIQTGSQIIIIYQLMQQDFYSNYTVDQLIQILADNELGILPNDTFEASTLFIFSNQLYLASMMAYSIGRPFKKSVLTNIWFCFNFLILFIINLLFAAVVDMRFDFFKFSQTISSEWLLKVFGWSVFWTCIMYLYEILVCQLPFIETDKARKKRLRNIV